MVFFIPMERPYVWLRCFVLSNFLSFDLSFLFRSAMRLLYQSWCRLLLQERRLAYSQLLNQQFSFDMLSPILL